VFKKMLCICSKFATWRHWQPGESSAGGVYTTANGTWNRRGNCGHWRSANVTRFTKR